MSAKLGEILVRENLITSDQLREALDYQRQSGGRLGSNIVKLGFISDDVITAVLSRQYGVPSVNLELFQIEKEVINLIPQEVAQKYSVLPISKVGATLTLAMAAVAISVGWWLGYRSLVLIYAVVLLQGLVNAVDNPLRRTFIRDMVDDQRLSNALGLEGAISTVSRTIGPAVAGVVISVRDVTV